MSAASNSTTPKPAKRYRILARKLRALGIAVADDNFDVLDAVHRILKLLRLSPYPHELASSGDRCAPDCAACRWASEGV
jgi:hypothetical protein